MEDEQFKEQNLTFAKSNISNTSSDQPEYSQFHSPNLIDKNIDFNPIVVTNNPDIIVDKTHDSKQELENMKIFTIESKITEEEQNSNVYNNNISQQSKKKISFQDELNERDNKFQINKESNNQKIDEIDENNYKSTRNDDLNDKMDQNESEIKKIQNIDISAGINDKNSSNDNELLSHDKHNNASHLHSNSEYNTNLLTNPKQSNLKSTQHFKSMNIENDNTLELKKFFESTKKRRSSVGKSNTIDKLSISSVDNDSHDGNDDIDATHTLKLLKTERSQSKSQLDLMKKKTRRPSINFQETSSIQSPAANDDSFDNITLNSPKQKKSFIENNSKIELEKYRALNDKDEIKNKRMQLTNQNSDAIEIANKITNQYDEPKHNNPKSMSQTQKQYKEHLEEQIKSPQLNYLTNKIVPINLSLEANECLFIDVITNSVFGYKKFDSYSTNESVMIIENFIDLVYEKREKINTPIDQDISKQSIQSNLTNNINNFNSELIDIMQEFPILLIGSDIPSITRQIEQYNLHEFITIRINESTPDLSIFLSKLNLSFEPVPISKESTNKIYFQSKDPPIAFKLKEDWDIENVWENKALFHKLDLYNDYQKARNNQNKTIINHIKDETEQFRLKQYSSQSLRESNNLRHMLREGVPHVAGDQEDTTIILHNEEGIMLTHFQIEGAKYNSVKRVMVFTSDSEIKKESMEKQMNMETCIDEILIKDQATYMHTFNLNEHNEFSECFMMKYPRQTCWVAIRIMSSHRDQKQFGFTLNKIKLLGCDKKSYNISGLYNQSEDLLDIKKGDYYLNEYIKLEQTNSLKPNHQFIVDNYACFYVKGSCAAVEILKNDRRFKDIYFFKLMSNQYSKEMKVLLKEKCNEISNKELMRDRKSVNKEEEEYDAQDMLSFLGLHSHSILKDKTESFDFNQSNELQDFQIAIPHYQDVKSVIEEICSDPVNFNRFNNQLFKKMDTQEDSGNADRFPFTSQQMSLREMIGSDDLTNNEHIQMKFYKLYIFTIMEVLTYILGFECKLVKINNESIRYCIKIKLKGENLMIASVISRLNLRQCYSKEQIKAFSLNRNLDFDTIENIKLSAAVLNNHQDNNELNFNVLFGAPEESVEEVWTFDKKMPYTYSSPINEQIRFDALERHYMTQPLDLDNSVEKIKKIIKDTDSSDHPNFMMQGQFKDFKWGNLAKDNNNDKVFKQSDRIYLINRMITESINIELLKENGLISEQNSMHQRDDLQIIQNQIAVFKKIFCLLNDEELTLINEYFGSEIALYFNYVNTQTEFLFYISIFSVITQVITTHLSDIVGLKDYQTLQGVLARCLYSIAISVIGIFLGETMKRRESYLRFLWGISDKSSELELVRSNFNAEYTQDLIHEKFSKTAEVSKFKVQISELISTVLIIMIQAIVAVIMETKMYQENLQRDNSLDLTFIGIKSALILANYFQIIICNKIWYKIATNLNLWEGYKFINEYNSQLSYKIFTFQFLNNQASLYYILLRFSLYDPSQCTQSDLLLHFDLYSVQALDEHTQRQPSCMTDIGNHMFYLIILFFLNNFVEIISSILNIRVNIKDITGRFNLKSTDHHQYQSINYDLVMEEDDSIVHEYLELTIQMGFIFIFGISFELAAVLCLITNLLEIRVDAYKIFRTWKRGLCNRTKSVGIFIDIIAQCSLTTITVNLLMIFLELKNMLMDSSLQSRYVNHEEVGGNHENENNIALISLNFNSLFIGFLIVENFCLYLKQQIEKQMLDCDPRVVIYKTYEIEHNEEFEINMHQQGCLNSYPNLKFKTFSIVEDNCQDQEFMGQELKFDNLEKRNV